MNADVAGSEFGLGHSSDTPRKSTAAIAYASTSSIQRRTVVQAQIHRSKPHSHPHPVEPLQSVRLTQSALNMAANHSHPEAESSGLMAWDRLVDDDGSSNSRNTNTLEGALMGSASASASASGSGLGSGLALGSCSGPYFHPPAAIHQQPPVLTQTYLRSVNYSIQILIHYINHITSTKT